MSVPFLLIDLDDTLCDTLTFVYKKLEGMGFEVPPVGVGRSVYYDALPDIVPGLTAQIVQDVLHTPGLFSSVKPFPGAVDVMSKLEVAPFVTKIVTSPILTSLTNVPEKQQWVEQWLGSYWLHQLVFSEDKTIVMGDYLIDDKPYITGVNESPLWKQVFYSQPHNVFQEGLRLDGWRRFDELYRILTGDDENGCQ